MKNIKKLRISLISRYLLNSFLAPFFAGLFFFTFIVLLFTLKESIKASIEKNIEVIFIVKLTLYSMGWTLGMTIPMSALLAIILAVGTMNQDQEIIAMRAGGITYARMLRPFLITGFFLFLLLIWFHQDVVPYCTRQMSQLTKQIFAYNPTAIIEPGQFNLLDEGKDYKRYMFVESIDNSEDVSAVMHNIQIRKTERAKNGFKLVEFIVAKKGIKIEKQFDAENKVKAIRLFDGFIYFQDDKGNSLQQVDFSHGMMDININFNENPAAQMGAQEISAMNFSTLSKKIDRFSIISKRNRLHRQELVHMQTEMYKRFSLALAPFLFLFLGFPLGIVNRRTGKGLGFGQSIIFIFIYFGLYLSADAFASYSSFMTPQAAAFLPGVVILLIALSLYIIRLPELFWSLRKFSYHIFYSGKK